MKVKDLIIKDEEFQGNKIKVLYLVLEDNTIYRVGTLKSGKTFNYVNCMHKEYKPNN